MGNQRDAVFAAESKVGKALTYAAAIALSAAFYWLYINLFLTIGEGFHSASEWNFLTDQKVTIGMAFDFVALGVLWRYLTPIRVCRFWRRGIEEIASPHVQAWRRGHRFAPMLALFGPILIMTVVTVAAFVIETHNMHSRPAPVTTGSVTILDAVRAAQEDNLLVESSVTPIPCDQFNGSSIRSDGK